MKIIRVIKNHSFARRRRTVGETLEVPDKYAHILEVLGVAVVIPPPVVKKPINPTAPVVPIEPKTADIPDCEPKRQYKRRDMKAED